nr:PREDICTED: tyrosine-protein phosphatase non-receptor type 18 isoform X3 [Rhinolophus sinicus]
MSRSLDVAQSFLEHLEALGDREGAVLAGEFSDIQARSAAWKAGDLCSTEAGSQPGNVRKNRYKDVLPWHRWKPGLHRHTGTLASYLARLLAPGLGVWGQGDPDGMSRDGEWEDTCIRPRDIFPQKKCERYWAQEQEPLQIGLFCITLARETWLNEDTKLRSLQVTFQKKSRSVYQLQYMSWPDRGVPSNPDHVLAMVEEARHLQGSGSSPLCVHCSAGCGRTGVLCAVDYVRQLFLTQMLSPNFSLFNLVLEMRKQRPTAVQTEEQYRFLHHTVAQMFSSALQNASPQSQHLKKNCAPFYDDALSLRTSLALSAMSCPPGEVLRSISAPGPRALAMADIYAVVQKRGAPARTGSGPGAQGTEVTPLYSQVMPSARRPQAPAEDAPGALPCRVSADPSPAGPGTYEDVADGSQTGGLGFNLRIGRPKGPRDPPAEWSRV